jgi:hypothetical protein
VFSEADDLPPLLAGPAAACVRASFSTATQCERTLERARGLAELRYLCSGRVAQDVFGLVSCFSPTQLHEQGYSPMAAAARAGVRTACRDDSAGVLQAVKQRRPGGVNRTV